MSKKFSIILNAYDTDMAQRHMTIACIGDIVRFTDKPYELIVVDNEPIARIRDDYKVFPTYDLVEVDPKLTVYESYNLGASRAKTDYLFFIQNDVFVHERTLNKLMVYLASGDWDMVFPQQIELSRADAKKILKTKDGQLSGLGWRDAGLIGITKESFERVGGWDGRFKNLLGEADLFARCENAHVRWLDQTNAFISHIKAGNNLRKPAGIYNEEMAHDAKLLKGEL